LRKYQEDTLTSYLGHTAPPTSGRDYSPLRHAQSIKPELEVKTVDSDIYKSKASISAMSALQSHVDQTISKNQSL
jgi:hypothetical protein